MFLCNGVLFAIHWRSSHDCTVSPGIFAYTCIVQGDRHVNCARIQIEECNPLSGCIPTFIDSLRFGRPVSKSSPFEFVHPRQNMCDLSYKRFKTLICPPEFKFHKFIPNAWWFTCVTIFLAYRKLVLWNSFAVNDVEIPLIWSLLLYALCYRICASYFNAREWPLSRNYVILNSESAVKKKTKKTAVTEGDKLITYESNLLIVYIEPMLEKLVVKKIIWRKTDLGFEADCTLATGTG